MAPGGACIFRSMDGGQSFGFVGSAQNTLNEGWCGDSLGHFFDGNSMAIARCDEQLDQCGYESGFAAYAAFIVWELYQGGNSNWNRKILTEEAKNANGQTPPFVASGGSHLTAYQTTWDAKEHVVYQADPYQLIELYYDNSQQKWYWAALN
jgi:hypothetical protein